jgi:hypothetical protein
VQWASPVGHFWVVSVAALTCVALALAAGVAAFRAENARVLMLALAFLSMAGIFTIHGLATPGVLVSGDYTGSYGAPSAYGLSTGTSTLPAAWLFNLTGLSARLAVAVSATFLAASTVTWPAPVERAIVRWRAYILGGAVALIAAYGVVGLTVPTAIPGWVVGATWLAWMTLSAVVVLGTITAVRYAVGYMRTGQQMFGAVALGAVLLVQAQLSLHFGEIWKSTFWLYHLQLIAGFLAILWGVVVEYSRGRAVKSFANLAVSDAVEQLRSGYAEPILALSAALEARDGYTLGHGERVAASGSRRCLSWSARRCASLPRDCEVWPPERCFTTSGRSASRTQYSTRTDTSPMRSSRSSRSIQSAATRSFATRSGARARRR